MTFGRSFWVAAGLYAVLLVLVVAQGVPLLLGESPLVVVSFSPWLWWGLFPLVLAVVRWLMARWERRLERARGSLDELAARRAVRPAPAPVESWPVARVRDEDVDLGVGRQ